MLPRDYLLFVGLIGSVYTVASEEENPPRTLTVTVGDKLSIPCPLAGPGSSVQWAQDGAAVVLEPGGHREWAVSPEGVPSLAVGAARVTDAGEWECRELGSDGSVRRRVGVLSLRVASPPSAPHMELEGRRLLHQATVTVKEPQGLSLHCIVEGASPPVRNIHWFIGASNVTASSELFVEFTAGAYTSRSVLLLNATRALHGSEVVCRAHHDTWRQGAATSVSLNVLYEPSFSISRDPGFGLPLVEGMRVSLLCQVDANPPSNPLWVRDDEDEEKKTTPPEEDDEGGTLAFDPVDRDRHSGWYRCTTTNDVFGSYASFGYFLNIRAAEPADPTQVPDSGSGSFAAGGCIPDGRPEVTAVNRSLAALSGRSALLSGQLCSTPRPDRVYWLLRHLVLRPGDTRHPYVAHNLTETDVPGCWRVVLEVVSLSLDDSGEVVLIATDPSGAAHAATFLLNVTHASPHATSTATTQRTGLISACVLLILLYLHWTLDNR